MQSTVCLILHSYIEIGLFPVVRSSLTQSSLFQADEDEGSSDWDNESGDGDNSSDEEDGEDKSPIEIIVGIVSFYLLSVNMLGEFYFVPQKITPINFLSAELSWHQSWLVAAVGGAPRPKNVKRDIYEYASETVLCPIYGV